MVNHSLYQKALNHGSKRTRQGLSPHLYWHDFHVPIFALGGYTAIRPSTTREGTVRRTTCGNATKRRDRQADNPWLRRSRRRPRRWREVPLEFVLTRLITWRRTS